MRGLRLVLALVLAGSTAHAETVTSSEVEAVSVTLYRDPDRGEGGIDRNWPGGYALITETRRITVPAGESVIRFEGVSEGMLPESAIVTGLPGGVREKNHDALLLSPAGLVNAYLTRRVHLTRTDRATGRVREQDAVIRAGPRGGVVVQTAEGVEALGCSGIPERLGYDGVPDGLFARPTLSVLTTSAAPVTATVQLSYIAQGFDWAANYVATVAPDGRTLDLFAWLTLANGGGQSFANAHTQAVAGQPNKEADPAQPQAPAPSVTLQCWPMDITSTHPLHGLPVPPPPPPPAAMAQGFEEIVVTGSRRSEAALMSPVAIVAVQEALGDLKLYRIPERVTVAAQAQKQVAMIEKRGVAFERIYGATLVPGEEGDREMSIILRMKNEKAKGLGVPLPAGGVAVFESVAGRPMLAGEDKLGDRAIGDEVEITVGASPDVRLLLTPVERDGTRRERYTAKLSNARAVPVVAEVTIPFELARKDRKVIRRHGQNIWRVEVPPTGTAQLDFALKVERVD